MARPRAFRDETWRLALARDGPALHGVADLLLDGATDESRYDGHRARAFAFALERRVDEALVELDAGATQDWPFPAAFAADVARVRYLAGQYLPALEALRLAVRGADHVDPAVASLVSACVRRDRRLLGGGVAVAVSAGTAWQRMRRAAAVVAAATRGSAG